MVRRCGDLRSDPVRGRGIGGAPAIPICHNDTTTLNLNVKALRAHLRHGDTFGACGTVCACQPSIDPVTCEVGGTFINQCIADCAGAEGCARLCVCAPTYDPVTCADGNTYPTRASPSAPRARTVSVSAPASPRLTPSSATTASPTSTAASPLAPVRRTAPGSAPVSPYSTLFSSATARSTSTSALPSASGRRSVNASAPASPRLTQSSAQRRSDLHQPVRRRLPRTAGMLPDLRLPARDRPGHLRRRQHLHQRVRCHHVRPNGGL